jgi:uncharacterized cupredoxin-like copper-binding protein
MVVLAVAAVACNDDDEDGGAATATPAEATPTEQANGGEGATVDVRLLEYTVAPDPASVAAGPVTFTANNIGGAAHTLEIIHTDGAPDRLPILADGSADEAATGITVLGKVDELAAGATGTLTLDLQPGTYVLICNIVTADGTSHFQQGMHATFSVTPALTQ